MIVSGFRTCATSLLILNSSRLCRSPKTQVLTSIHKMATTKVSTRKLGKYGPEVSALGYGCMGLSTFYGKPRPDEERLKFLDHIYAAGETHWDSADIYGDSEDLLGKFVSRRFLFANSNMSLLCFSLGRCLSGICIIVPCQSG